MRDDLTGYYRDELDFLRRMGQDFSVRYPKIAGRLKLRPDESEDPHVERLLEGVAFMAARIRLKLDDEFPEITESLLNVLYPHYLAPVPSMSIARFEFDPEQGKLTSGYTVPRGTPLFSPRLDGVQCRFRTCYPVTVWPIEVVAAELESRDPVGTQGHWAGAVLRLSLRCLNKATLSDLAGTKAPGNGAATEPRAGPLDTLRFCLSGELQLAYSVYEMIFNHADGVELRETRAKRGRGDSGKLSTSNVATLGRTCIEAVGFAAQENEALLPWTPQSFAGYRLLSEYFAFPEKFLFFDITGIGAAARGAHFGEQFELLIHLRDVKPPRTTVDHRLFHLGCTPIINLFSLPAVPLHVSRQQHEYRIIPDLHQQAETEVYSVDEVKVADSQRSQVRSFHPFYSYRHTDNPEGKQIFWYATRRPSQVPRPDEEGMRTLAKQDRRTEVYLSLVELNFDPYQLANETLAVGLTCTNGDLPGKPPFDGLDGFELERAGPLARVRCLREPTKTLRPPMRRAAHWRLISHLALNYLSIVAPEADGKPSALQEILKLYAHLNTSATRKQIDGLTHIKSRRVTRPVIRTGERVDAGYVRGVETTLEFDEEQFVGSGLYLFASVLERFLGLYASVNSFTELVAIVKQREGDLKRWRWMPRAGEQPML